VQRAGVEMGVERRRLCAQRGWKQSTPAALSAIHLERVPHILQPPKTAVLYASMVALLIRLQLFKCVGVRRAAFAGASKKSAVVTHVNRAYVLLCISMMPYRMRVVKLKGFGVCEQLARSCECDLGFWRA